MPGPWQTHATHERSRSSSAPTWSLGSLGLNPGLAVWPWTSHLNVGAPAGFPIHGDGRGSCLHAEWLWEVRVHAETNQPPAGAPLAQHVVTAVTYRHALAARSVVCLPISFTREDKAPEGKRLAGEVGAGSGPSLGGCEACTLCCARSCSAFTLTVPRASIHRPELGLSNTCREGPRALLVRDLTSGRASQVWRVV